jgi:hypothetical protein
MAVDIRVLGEDRVRIDEGLAIDLGPVRLRQIVRRIRLAPLLPGRPRMEVRILAITDAQGMAWPVRTWQWGDELEIRIGSGKSFLTGGQTVHLAYEVTGAVSPGRGREQLVWDVTGGEWELPVVEARVTVHLPPGAEPEEIVAGSEIGHPGESQRAAEFRTVDGRQARFTLLRGLRPRESFRVFLSWPAALTKDSGPLQALARWLIARPWYCLPIVALGVVLGVVWTRARARARGRAATAPVPMLTPAELGFLCYGELAAEDLVGAALDLARRGRLRIDAAADGSGYRFTADSAASSEAVPGGGQAPVAAERAEPVTEAAWPNAIFPRDAPPDADPMALAARIVRARPRASAEIVARLRRAGYLAPRGGRALGQRWALRLIAALALGFALALLSGARFPAAWPGLAAAAVLAASVPLAIDRRRRTARGEEAAAWAAALVARAGSEPLTRAPEPDAVFPIAVALGAGASWLMARRDAAEAGAARPEYWPSLTPSGERMDAGALIHELALLAAPFRAAFAECGRGAASRDLSERA